MRTVAEKQMIVVYCEKLDHSICIHMIGELESGIKDGKL